MAATAPLPAFAPAPAAVPAAPRALAPACPSGAPSHALGVLEALARASGTADEATLNQVLTADFYDFDGGARLDKAQFIAAVKTLLGGGERVNWAISNPDVHVFCKEAWVSFVSEAVGHPGDHPRRFLQSALLHHDGSGWRVKFLQSTDAVGPAPAPVLPAPRGRLASSEGSR